MKLLSIYALTTIAALACSIVNPLSTQAAELAPEAMVVEAADPTLSFEETLFTLINEERAKHGLHSYVLDETVDTASEARILELEDVFSHNRDGGRRFSTILVDLGISYFSAAEIIAAGQTSPERVLDAWLNSPRHCSRILSSEYTKIGVAHDHAENGTDYWEILFLN